MTEMNAMVTPPMHTPNQPRSPRAPRRRALHAVIAVALGALTTAVGCARRHAQAPPPPPPAVDVARPVVREITEWDEYTGRLAAVNTVEVRPRVSGYLESVHFKEGQIVRKGDLLFIIDPRPFRAILAAAEAELVASEARLELAKNDVTRAQGLVETRAISAEEFDRRNKAALEAQAVADAARARVERARLDLEFTSVRSPIDGRASNYTVTVGNLVTGGADNATLLTTIVSLDPIHCYFDANEQDYLKYMRLAAAGARPSSRAVPNPVRVALVDETDFRHEGRMDFVDNRIDELTGTIRGRAVLPNPDGLLVPGMFVRVRLIGETRPNAVLIPDQAIGADQANRVVYVVNDKNEVSLRTVVPGRLIDGLRVIRSGLDGTELIIVRGVQRVRPGIVVDPTTVDALSVTTHAAPRPDAPKAGTPASQEGAR